MLIDAPAIRAATEAEVCALLGALVLPPGTALAATGSFARGEPTPHSDLDLVLLYRGALPDTHKVWYPIWDAKKRLDYAVRTPAECARIAATDMTAALALLDLRFVAGQHELVEETTTLVRRQWRRTVAKSFNTLVDTAIARWNRSGSLVSMTRPDLKHGRGGLRDVELLKALGLANLCDVADLHPQRGLLLDVRTLLHVESRRARDVLDPEFATDIATQLGFSDRIALSRALADAGRTIDAALTEGLSTARQVLRKPRDHKRRPLDLGVVDAGEQVQLARSHSLDDPGLVLRVAAAAARTGLPVADATWRRLKQVPPLPTPWPTTAVTDFFALLSSPDNTAELILAMDAHGLWEKIVPSWPHIRGRMPAEPNHINTIDVHCLNTVARCAHASVHVSRPDLLLLAALFHDIGKGYGRPHAQVGAEHVARMAATMGLNLRDRMCVQTLVAEHTLLAALATTRDPLDDASLDLLLDALHYDPVAVELLRQLTEADARATGPGVWNHRLAHSVDTLNHRASKALTSLSPRRPHVSAPTEIGLSAHGDTASIHWRGSEIMRILGPIAAKGWNITAARMVVEKQQLQAEFEVRAMHTDGFNETEFIQAYKSGVFQSLPPIVPAAIATHWYENVLEVRAVDRRGAFGALLAALPRFHWCTVELPGATMIARFHLTGNYNRAEVERNVTQALANGYHGEVKL